MQQYTTRSSNDSLPPPADLEAESSVLSAILTAAELGAASKNGLAEAKMLLVQEHFYDAFNGWIYHASQDIEASGAVVDVLSVSNWLKSHNKLKDGNLEYLKSIAWNTPVSIELVGCARRIVDMWRLRKFVDMTHVVSAEAYTCVVDVDSFLLEARSRLDAVLMTPKSGDFDWVPSEELFAPLPPIPWTCKELKLCHGRPALWAGFGYSGKTIVVVSYLVHIASGERLWGQFPVKSGPVVHIDYEMGRRATVHRFQRIARAIGADHIEVARNIKVACLPDIYLTSRKAEDALCRALEGKVACGIDSLRACTPGADENDSAFRQWLDMLTRVGDKTQCQINVIHHAGKGVGDRDGREQPRGSSGIFDACGAVFTLTSEDSDAPKKITNVKTGAEASGSALEPFYLTFEDVASEDASDDHWGLVVKYKTEEQVNPPVSPEQRASALESEILAYVKKNSGCSTNEVKGKVPGRSEVKGAALEKLKRTGKLRCEKGENRSVLWHFNGTEEDTEK